MSDFNAIGGVSASLRDLLVDRMELPDGIERGRLVVSVGAPRSDAQDGQGAETARVNLFLYRVTENSELKNQDLPGRGHPGAVGHPPLSLDLHYLLTAYGTSGEPPFPSEITAQLLLGSAMRVLHDHAIIHPRLTTTNAPLPRPILHPSLQDEYENLRLAIDPLSLEDLSKVWTALTLPFRLAAAYQVTVVQIESQRRRTFPRLVGTPPAGPQISASPFPTPSIAEVGARIGAEERRTPYLRIGDIAVLRGHGFGTAPLRISIGELDLEVPSPADAKIDFVLPDEPALQPGVQSVQVVMRFAGLASAAVRSNAAVFMLVPRADTATVQPSRVLQIAGARLMNARRIGEVLIGHRVVDARDSLAGSSESALRVPLPDELPASDVPIVLSSTLAPFPTLPGASPLQLEVKLGSGTPVVATLAAAPTSLADAALLLQAALRAVPNPSPPLSPTEDRAYRRARVGIVGDRLAIAAGGLVASFTFADVQGDTTATTLGLTGPARRAYLSGALAPFPRLTASSPRLSVSVAGATAGTATFASVPASLASGPPAFAAALATIPALAGSEVGVMGEQLVVVPPSSAGALAFDAVPGVDVATVRELQLSARYPVRVRVHGAESFDRLDVRLPS